MNANQKAVDFLNEWSCKKFNGKTIKDIMTYDGFSFWWCAEFWLYYSFYYRDSLKKIVENLNSPNKEKLSFKERIRPWGIKQFLKTHAIARKLYWSFLHKEEFVAHQERQGQKVLAVCSYNWQNGDPYLKPMLEHLKNYNIVLADATQREYRGFSILKEKAKQTQRHILLEQYVGYLDILSISKKARHIQEQVRNLEETVEFKESWKIDGINIWELIKPQFDCYFKYRLEGHILDYECAKALLQHEKPNLVIYPCEGGDLAYIFFKLCQDKKIPCVGIQHGTMSYSPLTVHLPEEQVPQPTKLLVYGKYYADFLMKHGAYSIEKIEVTGNLRYDDYAGRYDKSVYKPKPILLYVGNILPSQQEYEEMTRAVFQVAKDLNMNLIVKQHPAETSEKIYDKFAKEIGITPIIVTKTASNYEMLSMSDVVIGAESTLNYEAMILNKPIINMSLGHEFSLPFVHDGAVIGIKDIGDIKIAVQKCLFDDYTRACLKQKMAKLVSEHCYIIDGKSAERSAEIIRGLL